MSEWLFRCRSTAIAPLDVGRKEMGTEYELQMNDIGNLLSVASSWHRKQLADLVGGRIKKGGDGFQFFDNSGAEMSLSEVHRRSQSDAKTQRSVYNLWFYYSH